jgi:hypothetical protein
MGAVFAILKGAFPNFAACLGLLVHAPHSEPLARDSAEFLVESRVTWEHLSSCHLSK